MNRDESVDVVVVWTTLPNSLDPVSFSTVLVEERLAACVTAARDVTSVYRWKDAVEQAVEHHLTIKTTAGRLERLQERIASLHPYDVPEFLVLKAEGSRSYLSWVSESTASSGEI